MFQSKTKIPDLVLLLFLILSGSCVDKRPALSDRPIAVLTFDDAVQSHLDYVAPLLQEYDFGATFFVTYSWMKDSANFLSWGEIKQLNNMGFEIGNHSWTHTDFSQPEQANQLEGELGLIEWMLARHGVQKPVSYAHTGNSFGPETIEALHNRGYLLARRGKQPEVFYGKSDVGPGYDPQAHHPLLVPATLDFYPDMDFKTFKEAMQSIPDHEISILQFHGVPDIVHPWVNTPPEMFKKYMDYLKEHDYQVIAMRDLEEYIPEHLPEDKLLNERVPEKLEGELRWPPEVVASRKDTQYWINLMRRHHYTHGEMGKVMGYSIDSIKRIKRQVPYNLIFDEGKIEVWPYPGGRHPRIDFTEGMLSPMRGTKLSVFLPWDKNDYVVLDIPEAVSTQYGLTFLGHTHIPTVFDLQKVQITNTDWKRDKKGNWVNKWTLPNNIEIGSYVIPRKDHVEMKLWFTNHSSDTLFQQLKTQVCLMLGRAQKFCKQTNENKLLECPVVAVQSKDDNHWIITGWEGCHNPWGNEDSPCLHADPTFSDCAPGETVVLRGVLRFYVGEHINKEIGAIKKEYDWL